MTKEDQYPSGDLIADITQIMRDADKAFETIGGSTRHYIRDVFIPLLEQKGFRFMGKKAMDEYAKQQASAFLAWHTNKFNEYAALTLSGQAISGELWGEINRFECATIEGRYEIFIEQQSKGK